MVEPQIADQLSRTISTELRSAYHTLLTKPVPDRFAQLLAELDKHPARPDDDDAGDDEPTAPRTMAKDRST